jgi:hypothetical protein
MKLIDLRPGKQRPGQAFENVITQTSDRKLGMRKQVLGAVFFRGPQIGKRLGTKHLGLQPRHV